jgi:hypothetical protein
MTSRIIRQQLTSPSKLTPVFSKKFDVCGMFKDSTMAVHKLRIEAIEEEG